MKEKKQSKSDVKSVDIITEQAKSKLSSKYRESMIKPPLLQDSYVKTKQESSKIGGGSQMRESTSRRPRSESVVRQTYKESSEKADC